jgi:hypothetical protein
MRNDFASFRNAFRIEIRWMIEGKGMIKVKSSQKIFTDADIASLTGICVEHLHGLAKTRHLGFIAPRPRQRVSRRISGCLRCPT